MTDIETLQNMDRPALTALWSDVYDTAPPKGISCVFMRRSLAFEMQARAHSGLSTATLKVLSKKRFQAASASGSSRLKPGGRLIREWSGKTHIVEVSDTGFLWQGRPYRSLSIIARAITGTHWSGPRFFGLTKRSGR